MGQPRMKMTNKNLIHRKSTSPIFFQDLQQYNILQKRLKEDLADIAKKEFLSLKRSAIIEKRKESSSSSSSLNEINKQNLVNHLQVKPQDTQ